MVGVGLLYFTRQGIGFSSFPHAMITFPTSLSRTGAAEIFKYYFIRQKRDFVI